MGIVYQDDVWQTRKTTLTVIVLELYALAKIACPGRSSWTEYWDYMLWTRKTTLAALVFELPALAKITCPSHKSWTIDESFSDGLILSRGIKQER